MQYRQLGQSNLRVSEFALGCMGFGKGGGSGVNDRPWTFGQTQADEVIKRALALGVNFFDTAPAYQSRASERILGQALRKFTDRYKVIVATKFATRTPDEIKQGIDGRQHVLNSLRKSLQNLQMNYVDLYVYHIWDWLTPMPDIMAGLGEAADKGLVKYIVISNAYAWQIAQINDYAKERHLPHFVSIQSHYNLIYREDERETFTFARENGLGTTPYSPLASGRLAHPFGTQTARRQQDLFSANDKYGKTVKIDKPIIDRVERLANQHEVSMATVALAWLKTKVTAPIVGATNAHHLDAVAQAINLQLTDDEIAFLEAPYQPHDLEGVMADNRDRQHNWTAYLEQH
jgi:aryl-alcohol dehydrogenase-like predicted oxidoreductase